MRKGLFLHLVTWREAEENKKVTEKKQKKNQIPYIVNQRFTRLSKIRLSRIRHFVKQTKEIKTRTKVNSFLFNKKSTIALPTRCQFLALDNLLDILWTLITLYSFMIPNLGGRLTLRKEEPSKQEMFLIRNWLSPSHIISWFSWTSRVIYTHEMKHYGRKFVLQKNLINIINTTCTVFFPKLRCWQDLTTPSLIR